MPQIVTKRNTDFESAKQDILSRLDILNYYSGELSASLEMGENSVLCPFHTDRNPSFSVNTNAPGLWRCFAGCGKGDAFAFHIKKHGGTFMDALKHFAHLTGVELAGGKRTEAPKGKDHLLKAWEISRSADTPPPALVKYLTGRAVKKETVEALWHSERMGFTFSAYRRKGEPKEPAIVFPLKDAKGNLIGIQNVFMDGQEPRKMNVKGSRESAAFFSPSEIPKAGTDQPVTITEAIIDAISVFDATGGAAVSIMSALSSEKLRALKLRDPVLFLDNDAAGREGTEKALSVLGEARVVKYLNGAKDANEILKSGNSDEIREMINNSVPCVPSVPNNNLSNNINKKANKKLEHLEENESVPCVPEFVIDDKGLFYIEYKKGMPLPPEYVCGPILVLAMTKNSETGEYGRLLEWQTVGGHTASMVFLNDGLIGDGNACFGKLALGGLDIPPGRRPLKLLAQYLHECKRERWITVTDKTGWHSGTYVLPDGPIGGGDIVFHAENFPGMYRQAGTLDQWREHVSALCMGNSRLLFAVSAAFASILLFFTGDENGGIHICGDSSTGKSTVGAVAGSVFCAAMQTWNATVNGLGAMACTYNDALMVLDELSQCDPKAAGETAYLLSNGIEKGRANRSGGFKQRRTWRLLFLSTGEIDLSHHLQADNRRHKAGQGVRLLTVPADAGAGLGIFETLNGFTCGADLANALKELSSTYYGTAARAFIEKISGRADEVKATVKQLRRAFIAEYLPFGAESQVGRAADRFALIAAAGELATQYGITGWDPGDAEAAAAGCFQDWMKARGGVGNHEDRAILEQIREHFERFGCSRYGEMDGSGPIIYDRAGFRENTQEGTVDYYVLPGPWESEVCKGLDSARVNKALLAIKALEPDKEGKASISKRGLPGFPERKRCYHIFGAVLFSWNTGTCTKKI